MSGRLLIATLLLLWPGFAVAADAPMAPNVPNAPAVANIANAPKAPAAPVKHAKRVAKPADVPDAEQRPAPHYNAVLLQGLNKVTGRISRLEAPVGTVMRFGNLEIIAQRCWKSAPEDSPENASLLEISELKPGEPPQRIFLGWMFSSSPGLSGLEHPVYDVTLLACEENASEPEKKEPEKKEPEKKK